MTLVAPASANELEDVLSLLRESRLPEAGVAEHFSSFFVARAEGRLRGVAGLERHGEFGLLRSLAVRSEARGSGLGARLTERVIREAREWGLRALYLLTTTASDYFPRFGFETVERRELPGELAASRELQDACPDTAICMRLTLNRSSGLQVR